MKKSDYHEKLKALFNNSDFEKIEDFKLEDTRKSYRELLNDTILGCLGQNNKWLVEPKNSIASIYGKVKYHKQGAPLRPIGTGYSHIVDGAEHYLKNILEPLLNKCTYLVDRQKTFKNKFLTEKNKFNVNLRTMNKCLLI